LRYDRENKVKVMREKLHHHIPPLFRAAHIRHLKHAFLNALVNRHDGQGLFLWGGAGVGKSFAMMALLRNAVVVHNVHCRRITFDGLCSKIRSTFASHDESERAVIESMIYPTYLFIEDLGSTVGMNKSESDFNSRIFLMILDGRIEQMKPTFITSNKSPEEIGRSFGERVASRLQTLKAVECAGKDRRTLSPFRERNPKQEQSNAVHD